MTVFKPNGQPIVATLSMDDSLTKVAAAIEAEYSGCGLHSQSRFGKSTLGEFICGDHEWTTVKYFAKHAIVRSLGVDQNSVLDWLLAQIGVNVIARQPVDLKISRLVNTVALQLLSSGASHYLLVMDDANLIEPEAFQHLVTIDNALQKGGISLFFVFLFQDNHTTSKREGINKLVVSPQARSRFLTRYHRIFGIRGPEDIYVFLQNFEDKAEMVQGSSVTLPRHLAPALYDSDFRMCNASQLIWDQGRTLRVAANRLDNGEWPMKAMWLIAYYLSTRVICQPGFKEFSEGDAIQAIRFSDLAAYDGASGAVEFSE